MAEEFQLDDLSDAVDTLANGIFTVTRKAVTVYTDGRRATPTTTTFEARALIYPVGGRTLDRLPEGLRTHEAIGIISASELRTAGAGGEGDIVTYAGGSYQVQNVERWQPSGNFFRYIATRVASL